MDRPVRSVPHPADFAARLRRGRVLLDAALGSALRARGLAPDEPPERWNLERPHEIARLHVAHLAAGSEVIQTNTFGANRIVLSQHGLAPHLAEVNATAVRIARDAVAAAMVDGHAPAWVAGNLGPCRVRLPPAGDADPRELEDAFAEQAEILLAHGADFLAIETMTDLREAVCAVRGARRVTDRPVTVCLSFDSTADRFVTAAGDAAEDVPKILADVGATAVGSNCGGGSGDLATLAPVLLAASPVPVIVKPSAGPPEWQDGRAIYRQDPAEFARDGRRAVRLGVAAIGGCCGTDERFLRALRRALAEPGAAGRAV